MRKTIKVGIISLILGGALAVPCNQQAWPVKTTSLEKIIKGIDEMTPARIEFVGEPSKYSLNPWLGWSFEPLPVKDSKPHAWITGVNVRIYWEEIHGGCRTSYSTWNDGREGTASGLLNFLSQEFHGIRPIVRNPFDNTRYYWWDWKKEGNIIQLYMPKEIDKGPVFHFMGLPQFSGYNPRETYTVQMVQEAIKLQSGIYINFDPEPFDINDISTPYGPINRAEIPIDFGRMTQKKWLQLIGKSSLYDKELLICKYLSKRTGKLWTLNKSNGIHTIRKHNNIHYRDPPPFQSDNPYFQYYAQKRQNSCL